jgi:chitin synthase
MSSAPTTQQNLAALPAHSMSDTNITAHVASRFHSHLPITNLSSQGYIAVNTYTSSSKGPNGGKEGSAMGAAEELANRMWARLGSRQENQAAIFL